MIEFFVPGAPVTAGSKRAFMVGQGASRRPIITDDTGKKGKNWRASIQSAAMDALGEREKLTGPLMFHLVFYLQRPKGHYGTGRNEGVLKPTAPLLHDKRPDATKLLRAVEDALNGILWSDDAQIAIQSVRKYYANKASGVSILVLEEKRRGSQTVFSREGGSMTEAKTLTELADALERINNGKTLEKTA